MVKVLVVPDFKAEIPDQVESCQSVLIPVGYLVGCRSEFFQMSRYLGLVGRVIRCILKSNHVLSVAVFFIQRRSRPSDEAMLSMPAWRIEPHAGCEYLPPKCHHTVVV